MRFVFTILFALFSTSALADVTLSYAGRLTDQAGKPLPGPVDVEVRFFDAPSAGSELGTMIPFEDVALSQGTFQLPLDLTLPEANSIFGDGTSQVFIEVKAAGKSYPRQLFSTVPYALRVPIDNNRLEYDGSGRLTVKTQSLGAVTLGSEATLELGTYDVNSEPTLLSSLTGADRGATWYNESSNQIKFWNGAVAQTLGFAGSGVLSLNGVQANDQILAVDHAGSTLEWDQTPTIDTNTLHIPLASAGAGVTGGLISNGDYVAFSNKQPAIGYTTVNKAGDTITSLEVTNAVTLNGMPQPLGAASKGRIYFDSTTKKFMVSEDNGAYVPLVFIPSAIGAGGTGIKVTYDTFGRVTSTAALVAGDIPGLDAAKITSGTFTASQIPALDAAKITTGTFTTSQIPALDAAKITTGTFTTSQVPALDAAKITTGTFTTSQIPALDAAKITTGTFTTSQIPALDAAKITTGTFTTSQIPALDAAKITSGTFSASQVPALDAAKITTGVFGVTSGGTGAATLTSKGILLGNGTSPISASAALTNGQVLVGSTGLAPVAATLTGTANQVNVTNGAGTITLSGPQDLAAASSPTFNNMTLNGGLISGSILANNGPAAIGIFQAQDNGTPVVTIADGGNIGVGTTSPATKLELVTDGSDKAIKITNATLAAYNMTLGVGTANSTISTASTDLTIAPQFRLLTSIAGGAWANGYIFNQVTPFNGTGYPTTYMTANTTYSPTSGSDKFIGFQLNPSINQTGSANGNYTGFEVNATEVSATGTSRLLMDLKTNGASQMVVTSGGSVGIGSAAPNSRLDVNGTVTAAGLKVTTSPTSGHVLTSDASGTATWQAPAAATWASPGTIGSTTPAAAKFTGVSIGTTTAGTDLFFGSGANRAISVQNQATAGNSLTVQAGGTSGSNLDGGNLVLASGTANGTGTSQIQFQTANGGAPATSMTILGNGNVGIGSTTPGAKLDVAGGSVKITTVGEGVGQGPTDAVNPRGVIWDGSGTLIRDTGDIHFMMDANNDNTGMAFRFSTNGAARGAGTELFRIQEDGKVGVGSVNPSSKLTVDLGASGIGVDELSVKSSGSESVLALRNSSAAGRNYLLGSTGTASALGTGKFVIYDQTSGTTPFTIHADGSTSIGTTSPNGRLYVGGTQTYSGVSNVYGMTNGPITDLTGTGAVPLVLGLHNVTNIDSSLNDPNLTELASIYARYDLAAGYSGTVTTASGILVAPPGIYGTTKVADNAGVRILGSTNAAGNNSGNTTGTIENTALKVHGSTSAAAAGGVLNNYSAYFEVPNGSGAAGTTNNYGVVIAGNPTAGDLNYALYSNSTAPSSFAGPVEAPNIAAAPIMSTQPGTRYNAALAGGTYGYTGESITVTVPAGPARRYRVIVREMISAVATTIVISCLSTSNATCVPSWELGGTPYNHVVAASWVTTAYESIITLSPGTYTYYFMVTPSGATTVGVANESVAGRNYSNIMFVPY